MTKPLLDGVLHLFYCTMLGSDVLPWCLLCNVDMDDKKNVNTTERTVVFRFVYCNNDGVGKLLQPDIPIQVVTTKSLSGEDLSFTLRLTHDNYARCLLVEVDGADIHLVYEWRRFVSLSLYSATAALKAYLTSDHPTVAYISLSESHRRFIRGMIDFVISVHNQKKSMGGFNIDRLCIVDEKGDKALHFLGVLFYEGSVDRKKADFYSIALVIKQIIPASDKIFLIDDLVKKLEAGNCTEDVDLIAKHLAIMSPVEKTAFIRNYVDLIAKHLAIMSPVEKTAFIRNCTEKKPAPQYSSYGAYRSALKSMGKNRGWTKKFKKCCQKPGRGPMYDCFRYGEGGYKDDTCYDRDEVNESLLSFCRNMDVHLKQRIDGGKVKHDEVTDEHITSIILSEFQEQLVRFQEELYHEKILGNFC
ncbi:hypothetical protein PHJA_002859300 [Phtheirospermum japonicum]|uniref:Uncharacterized protein n=1 Tax=Phtheirospermum japonicum TaxID=374723 RepID=A0A830DMY4_9LAMI|nr:hypothetical protein PHJA_002859300 [Phtheirospermum japonicum]